MNVFSKVFVAGALAFTSLASHAVAEEVLNVDIDSFFVEFSKNASQAEQKYKNTPFNLKAKIFKKGESQKGDVYLDLYGELLTVPVVRAYLTSEAVEKAKNLDVADKVTLLCARADKPNKIIRAYPCYIVK